MTRNRAVQMAGGVVLGMVCAIVLKALLWLVPLMMFVGD
jgi:hypothetical protein